MTQAQQDIDVATDLIEQVRNISESSFYRLRDDVLDHTELFEIRIRLLDMCDTVHEATRYIEREQRRIESQSA